jgi:hypothetical protein
VDIIIKDKGFDILDKDCVNFVPLDDGTIIGERKYCNLSFECKQVGMKSEYVQGFDLDGNVVFHDYLCIGKLIAHREERSVDEEAR